MKIKGIISFLLIIMSSHVLADETYIIKEADLKNIIQAINVSNSEEVINKMDINKILLLSEANLLSGTSTTVMIDQPNSADNIKNVLFNIQNQLSENDWNGFDLAVETIKLKDINIARSPITRNKKSSFPMEIFVSGLKDMIQNSTYNLEYVNYEFIDIKKQTTAPFTLYSDYLQTSVLFDVDNANNTHTAFPLNNYVTVEVKVIHMGKPLGNETIYLQKSSGNWKLIGSSNGLIGYLPAFSRLNNFPNLKAVIKSSSRGDHFYLRYEILPKNKVQIIGFGTKDVNMPFFGPAIFDK